MTNFILWLRSFRILPVLAILLIVASIVLALSDSTTKTVVQVLALSAIALAVLSSKE